MKFRCRMIDVIAMRDFTNIVNVISRMTKKCVLRLTPEELCFTVGDDRVSLMRVEVSQSHFFNEYIMTGVSEEQNEIYLEFDATMFARSLSSLRMTAKSVKIKLTNKRQPCLTLEIDLPSLSIESRHCVHDVPVRVVPRKEWTEYRAPNVPEYDICLDMPQLKQVRNIVDRMKNMSSQLTLIADGSGTLVLRIEAERASVSTHFQGLQVWQESQRDGDEKISATVDIKKFLMFLGWDIIHPDSVKCNMVKERMVNWSLNLTDSVKIQYFVPAMTS